MTDEELLVASDILLSQINEHEYNGLRKETRREIVNLVQELHKRTDGIVADWQNVILPK